MEEILAVTKHLINSNLDKPLNELIDELCSQLSQEEKTLLNSIISKLDNSTYGLSALKTILDAVKTNTSYSYTISTSGSEKLLATIINNGDYSISSTSLTTLGSFVAPLNGTVTINITAEETAGSSASLGLYVTEYIKGIYCSTANVISGGSVETTIAQNSFSIGYKSEVSKQYALSVEQGKRYYIKAKNTSTSGTGALHVTNLKITANLSRG